MAVAVSYKSRIKHIIETLKPLATEYGFLLEMADQKIDKIRNSMKPLMFVGINNHRKLSYQYYKGDWNAEGGYYETKAVYSSLNTIFVDFYTFDYNFIDVAQEVGILLNFANFSLYDMTGSFFEVVTNDTVPDMIQSQLKQTSKVINTFMMTDNITLPPVYKADKITITGKLAGMNLNLEVNLDG
jgi:hypothetical protein